MKWGETVIIVIVVVFGCLIASFCGIGCQGVIL
jgi:hypothetical protein